MVDKSASEIARETLKLLAYRRLLPTPDNYRALYNEVAGLPATDGPAFPQERFQPMLRVLPAQTPAQKRLLEQFETAIKTQDWAALQNVLIGYANLGLLAPSTAEGYSRPAPHIPPPLAEQIALMVEHTLPALGSDDPRVLEMADQVMQFLRQPKPDVDTAELLLKNFGYRLSFATEEQASIRTALLQMLELVFENIDHLSLDDRWLQGQVQALRSATTPPLTLRQLDDVQMRLKDVIFKQTEAKERMVQAQSQMKEMLATFVDRLAQMGLSSATYHEQLERCAGRISQATQLHELTPLLEEIMTATRTMTVSSKQAHSELQDLRQRTEASHAEIDQLRKELEQTSALARHDPLTGALNRKGLDEALVREIARFERLESSLCLALLDLDNFKALNDRLGHASGDRALQHLVDVTRSVMRPQDQLARYGGEEFVIILPDTELTQAVEAMRRLQRELTTRYFLDGNERVLITFSAGVSQLAFGESREEALRRADQAMYQAKRAGKNRVMAA